MGRWSKEVPFMGLPGIPMAITCSLAITVRYWVLEP